MEAFELRTHPIGAGLLRPLSPGTPEKLGAALAAMPPWSVIGWPAERLTASFHRQAPSVRRFELMVEDELAGTVTIQDPFLHGPYLQLLAVLPGFQGQNSAPPYCSGWSGRRGVLRPASSGFASRPSTPARAPSTSASASRRRRLLDKLASDLSDEILMRKRLSYSKPRWSLPGAFRKTP